MNVPQMNPARPTMGTPPDLGRKPRENKNARADQDGGGQNGVGQAIGNRVECLAQRLKTLRVDLVLEGNIDLPMLDALIEMAEVVREIFEEIKAFAEKLPDKGKDSASDDICPRFAAWRTVRRA